MQLYERNYMINTWKRSHLITRYIKINNRTCTACWKCIEVCEGNVIGKVDLFFHKHTQIDRPEMCTGCLKCVRACNVQSIIRIPKNMEVQTNGRKNKYQTI
jgi:ferredoxin